MISNSQPRIIPLNLLLFVFSISAAYPSGIEIKNVTFCGSHDKTAKVKFSPWPFIPSGTIFNVSLTFTPAVDVVYATSEYEAVSVFDGKVVFRGRKDDLCDNASDLCSIPAGETYVGTSSLTLLTAPPFLKMQTFRVTARLFNGEYVMFFCVESVIKIY